MEVLKQNKFNLKSKNLVTIIYHGKNIKPTLMLKYSDEVALCDISTWLIFETIINELSGEELE